MRVLLTTFVLSTLALAVCAPVSAQVSEQSYPVDGATELRLNVSGNVHVIPSSSAQDVSFHVQDYGPPLPAMHFTTTRSRGRLTISISGPSKNVLPFTGASGYELQVTYPANLKLDLREFQGHVQADQLVAETSLYDADGSIAVSGAAAALTAEADSGAIDVTGARGNVSLTTGTGAVTAALAAGWRGNLVRMESSDGPLHLAVPAGFRGSYDLTSAQGAVRNSLAPVKGGAVVFMLTQNGDVSISPVNQ